MIILILSSISYPDGVIILASNITTYNGAIPDFFKKEIDLTEYVLREPPPEIFNPYVGKEKILEEFLV
jgi:hypothetical protein